MRIVLYSTTSCQACRLTKLWLKKHSFEFTEVICEPDDRATADFLIKEGWSRFPVVYTHKDNEDVAWDGYNIEALRKLL